MEEITNSPSFIFLALVIIDIAVIVLSAALHILGVFLMFKLRRPKNLQIILIHLSFSEITIQTFRFVSAIYFYMYYEHESFIGYQVTRTLTIQGWCVSYIMVMITVALDPLLIVVLKTRYMQYMKRRNLKFVLAICWAIGIINAGVNFAFTYETREKIAAYYTFPIITSIFLVFSIASYSMIYKSIKDKTRNIPRVSVSSGPSLKFHVPILINLTFFVFCLVPSISQVIIGNDKLTKSLLLALGISFSMGFVLDALIYMLLHPMVKKLLFRYVCRRKSNAVITEAISSRIPSHRSSSNNNKTELKEVGIGNVLKIPIQC